MNEMMHNTVQFRFPPGSPRPSWNEIANFLKQLDTDPLLMESAYKTARDRSLFIKFISQDAMKTSLKKNLEPRAFVYSSGKSVEVRMTIAGTDMRYIRVFDLPPEISDESLSLVLAKFGNVEYVTREKFPAESGLGHLQTGVRGVYLDVERNVPPFVDVCGWRGNVFYSGLKDTCFFCQGVGHRRDSCPQRIAQNSTQKDKQTVASYAGIVAGSETESGHKSTETLDEEIIEVLEESFEHPTEALDTVEQVQPTVGQDELEKEKKRKEGIEVLKEVAQAFQEAMVKSQAQQRRARFAASGSGSSSGSSTVPKKKCARKTNY